MPYMLGTEITDAFVKRGWAKRAGGDLYFDGKGGSDHPHLHLRVNAMGNVVPVGRDIRLAVTMLAWSDGGQGRGGGGTTFIQNSNVMIRNWQGYNGRLPMTAGMWEEFAYVMGYFTLG